MPVTPQQRTLLELLGLLAMSRRTPPSAPGPQPGVPTQYAPPRPGGPPPGNLTFPMPGGGTASTYMQFNPSMLPPAALASLQQRANMTPWGGQMPGPIMPGPAPRVPGPMPQGYGRR